jgi:hypothetical protein
MFKSITAKAITAVTTAALAAALTIFLTPGVVPEAQAHSQVAGMLPAAPVATGLAAGATGTGCSSRGWPDFERSCLFDLRTPAQTARTVRMIARR